MSGALTITDLDDFLSPSQACIIPVRGPKSAQPEGPTEIHIDSENQYYEVSTYPSGDAGPSSSKLEKAEINLNDCLACSGCITSTESMLITLQSHKEVLEYISQAAHAAEGCNHTVRTPVLSISPQTLASLSAYYSTLTGRQPIPLRTLLRRLRKFLGQKKNGGWRVWDTTFARHISLRETTNEFHARRQAKDKGKARGTFLDAQAGGPLPMLASACPGWVCYAEKAQGDLLPFLSTTRSSQGIMGALVKSWFAVKTNTTPDHIYHVTAMPCYDKKLEASRSDFYNSIYSTRDTDCVLTTGELDLLLRDLNFDPYASYPDEELLPPTNVEDIGCSPWPEMIQHQGSSSGSYLQIIMDAVRSTHPNPTTVNVREIRGSTDNVEYLIIDMTTNEVIFKGAKCYGFRNLQNLVRKVGKETGLSKGGRAGASKLSAAIAARRRKARTGTTTTSTPGTPGTPGDSDAESLASREEKTLDFVEVMACPGGCVNGGGQMKPVSTPKTSNGGDMEVDEEGYPRPMPDEGVATAEEGMRWSTKEWVSKVEQIYWTGLPTPPASPKGGAEDDLSRADQLADICVSEMTEEGSAERKEKLHTQFRKVEGDILGSGGVSHEAVKW